MYGTQDKEIKKPGLWLSGYSNIYYVIENRNRYC